MKIEFLFENSFPVADASANRLLSIAKGVVENGSEANIICLRAAEKSNNIINKEWKGIIENVSYIYPCKTTISPKNKIRKMVLYFWGLFTSVIYVIKSHRMSKINALISYSFSIEVNLLFYFLCKILNIKFAYMVDEYPYSVLKPTKYSRFFNFMEIKILPKLFDIILPMTFTLKDYYNQLKTKKTIIEQISMTVQPERFSNNIEKLNIYHEYFLYAGYLGNNKDGVDIMIKAFAIVSKKYPQYKLYILGYSDDKKDFEKLHNLVAINNLNDNVVFTGKIHRDEIPKYFCHAKGLLLARPNNIQAQAGFPTKLGEYLATGKPVVVTNVGEIPIYLKDNVNAYIAESDNINSFAQKVIELIENPQKSQKIGVMGKKLTENEFNYKVQANKILNTIK